MSDVELRAMIPDPEYPVYMRRKTYREPTVEELAEAMLEHEAELGQSLTTELLIWLANKEVVSDE
jgi:hypothetical protein